MVIDLVGDSLTEMRGPVGNSFTREGVYGLGDEKLHRHDPNQNQH